MTNECPNPNVHEQKTEHSTSRRYSYGGRAIQPAVAKAMAGRLLNFQHSKKRLLGSCTSTFWFRHSFVIRHSGLGINISR